MTHPIAIERCPTYDLDAVQAAVDAVVERMGGWERWVGSGQLVLVKPNLLASAPADQCATTHPAVVEAVIRRVVERGGRAILADSPAFGRLEEVAERAGLAEVARRYRVPLTEWRRALTVRCPDAGIARSFKVARAAWDADLLINLAKLKAHRQAGFSGATKNLFGCMPGKRKACWHMKAGPDHRFARMIVAFSRCLPPALHLMDAVVAMEGNGPRCGRPRPVGVILGGEEPLALDWAAAEILGLPSSHRLVLTAAVEQGFAVAAGEGVQWMGPPLDRLRLIDFEAPLLIGTSFSPPRVVWSTLKNLYLRGRRPPCPQRADGGR